MSESPMEDGLPQDTLAPTKPQRRGLAKWSRFFGCLAWIFLYIILLMFVLGPHVPGYQIPGLFLALLAMIPVSALVADALEPYIRPAIIQRDARMNLKKAVGILTPEF